MVTLLASLISVLDQITKHFVEKNVREGERVEVVKEKLYICNVKNSGAAGGLFSDKPKLLAVLTAVSCVGIIRDFARIRKEGRMDTAYKVSLACIIGGAAGNITDRIMKKGVTDFIYFKPAKLRGEKSSKAPVFNLADVAVFVGGAIYWVKSVKSLMKKKD